MLRKYIEYAQLPLRLRVAFAEADFLDGYDFSTQGFVIAWFLNRKIGKQQEVEFSLEERRILSRDERERALPAKEEILLPDQGYRVQKGYWLEPNTDVRYETYDVYPEGSASKLLTCEQIYFAPALIDIGQVVRSAVKEASFPLEYARWSVPERVSYWVSALYRLRHQLGEIGAQEDDVFDPKLVNKMRAIDANIDSILPIVLGKLAAIESVNPRDLIQSFGKRTGFSLPLQ